MARYLNIAIDANEANTFDRVGSNVYAYQVLKHLDLITKKDSSIKLTVLLSSKPVKDMPKTHEGLSYLVLKPKFLWTQWALPIYLFKNRYKYHVLLSLGHYAPRISLVPYISSVMDLGYIHFPAHFNKNDLFKLTNWTKYSVKNAKQILTISEFSKKEIVKHYHKDPKNIFIGFPSFSMPNEYSVVRYKSFLRKHKIQKPYIFYLGTLQPRKNLNKLISAFEIFLDDFQSLQNKLKTDYKTPQLVIGGKIGWLADDLLLQVKKSKARKQIIMAGFIPDELKQPMFEHATCSVLIGLHEGFGIPALESLATDTIPVVAESASLPEVVGDAGVYVNPHQISSITEGLKTAFTIHTRKKRIYKLKARKQLKKFNWQATAEIVLLKLKQVAHHV
jgi:glycosyltransferase involved in cell wall biosynthesis